MEEIEFKGFPKIPRLNREIVITEKIDGTNGCIIVDAQGDVYAQSRNRFVTLSEDNAGFAKWVYSYKGLLAETLGEGYHYGEWWGSGINRGYGIGKNGVAERFFSLFNVGRWAGIDLSAVPGLDIVPVLYRGNFNTEVIEDILYRLEQGGSKAMPGYEKPEGVVVWHEAARQLFKVTIEGDEKPKGSTEQ